MSEAIYSCPAPFGIGGLGRHFAEVVDAARGVTDVRYFALAKREPDAAGTAIPTTVTSWFSRFTPMRFDRTAQSYWANVEFDRAVARRLDQGRRCFAFQGAALRTFRRARALGYEELHLETATAHVDHAFARYAEAYRRHPLERDWLGERLRARTVAEYAAADVIWVNSEYSFQTFVAAGIDRAKLRRRSLSVDGRYFPQARKPHDGFHIVNIGSLTVTKGTPILIEAFAGLDDPKAKLTLIGGSGSSGMRRYLEAAQTKDARISIAPGDPLPHIMSADVCVHPSYSDGFGYGPAEALACGVPVIATEDTGMKELITPGSNGWIVPTGDVGALAAALRNSASRRHELSGTVSRFH